jgi:hypothetical protein
MLGTKPRVGEHAQRATAHAIANLLNSAPSWLMQHELNDHERDELLENMVSGAIERLLRPSAPRAVA